MPLGSTSDTYAVAILLPDSRIQPNSGSSRPRKSSKRQREAIATFFSHRCLEVVFYRGVVSGSHLASPIYVIGREVIDSRMV